MDGAVLGMVTEGGDWVVMTSHFYGSHKGWWKSTATLCMLYGTCNNNTEINFNK